MRGWIGVLAALVVLATGCTQPGPDNGIASAGGATGSASRPVAPTTTLNPLDVQRKWAQCMRDHGVDVPDPDPVEGKILDWPAPNKGTAEEKLLADAEEACREWDPGALPSEPNPERQEQWRRMAQCLRDRGFDVPDPDPNSNGPALPERDVLVRPDFQKAQQECAEQVLGPDS